MLVWIPNINPRFDSLIRLIHKYKKIKLNGFVSTSEMIPTRYSSTISSPLYLWDTWNVTGIEEREPGGREKLGGSRPRN